MSYAISGSDWARNAATTSGCVKPGFRFWIHVSNWVSRGVRVRIREGDGFDSGGDEAEEKDMGRRLTAEERQGGGKFQARFTEERSMMRRSAADIVPAAVEPDLIDVCVCVLVRRKL